MKNQDPQDSDPRNDLGETNAAGDRVPEVAEIILHGHNISMSGIQQQHFQAEEVIVSQGAAI